MVIGLFALTMLRVQFEENPLPVTALVLVSLGFVYLAWRKRRSTRSPAWTGTRSAGHALPASTVETGTEFEWHVVDLLRALGYRSVKRVGGSGDNGIDIVAQDKRGLTFLVQCKRFTTRSKVGSGEIQKLLGAVVHHGADGGIFFTTSAYTPAAMELARSGRIPITLYDGRHVAQLSRS